MPRKESSTADTAIPQKADIDLSLDSPIIHGEEMPNIAHEHELAKSHEAALAFMEEPVTIRIEENSSADFPETHVPVSVNGKSAEVLQNGQWLAIGWLPIGVPLVTKRKYVEVLARSRTDAIRTQHDDATVERPRNTIRRTTRAQYPLSILEDRNPRGHEWLSRIVASH